MPTRIGSPIEITATANSGNQSISVPTDATLIVVVAGGFPGDLSTGWFSGGSVTLNGQALTLGASADSSNTSQYAAAFYRVNPATGTQTLAWDWAGTSVAHDQGGYRLVYSFYKAVDTAALIRDSDGVQATSGPFTTKTLTAQTGDLIVAFAHEADAGTFRTATWTSATEIAEYGSFGNTSASDADAAPSGNQSVSCSFSVNNDGAIVALVLKPGAGGGVTDGWKVFLH